MGFLLPYAKAVSLCQQLETTKVDEIVSGQRFKPMRLTQIEDQIKSSDNQYFTTSYSDATGAVYCALDPDKTSGRSLRILLVCEQNIENHEVQPMKFHVKDMGTYISELERANSKEASTRGQRSGTYVVDKIRRTFFIAYVTFVKKMPGASTYEIQISDAPGRYLSDQRRGAPHLKSGGRIYPLYFEATTPLYVSFQSDNNSLESLLQASKEPTLASLAQAQQIQGKTLEANIQQQTHDLRRMAQWVSELLYIQQKQIAALSGGAGGGGGGGATAPELIRRSRFGEAAPSADNTPAVALALRNSATEAGVAPGFD